MPPKIKITKDDIINTTLEIVRRDGADAINARTIAANLGCSTQPIFSNFASMDELRLEVSKKAFDIYWDNSIAKSLVPSVIHWWVFGLWIVSLMVLFSVASKGSSVVLLGCGGAVLLSYLIGLIPKCSKYLPTYLTDGNSLIYGAIEASNYSVALIVTVASAVIFFAASIPIFNRRQL